MKIFKKLSSFWSAIIINLAVCAIWYFYEYDQFGELQWNRTCDNVVGLIYFFIIWWLLAEINSLTEKLNKKNNENGGRKNENKEENN